MLPALLVLVLSRLAAGEDCTSALVLAGEDLCDLNLTTGGLSCGVIDWAGTGRNGTITSANGLAIEPATETIYAVLSVQEPARRLQGGNGGGGGGSGSGTGGGTTERDLVTLAPNEDYSSITVEYIGNTALAFSALAFHCSGALVGVTGNSGNCAHCLYVINTETAATTMVAQLDSSDLGNALFYDFDRHEFLRLFGTTATGIQLERIDFAGTLDDHPTYGNFSAVTRTVELTLADGPIKDNGIQAASYIGGERALVVNQNDTVHLLNLNDGTSTVLVADNIVVTGDLDHNPKAIYCLNDAIYQELASDDCTVTGGGDGDGDDDGDGNSDGDGDGDGGDGDGSVAHLATATTLASLALCVLAWH